MAPSRIHLPELLPAVMDTLADDAEWTDHLINAAGIHLAVLVEPFLTFLLSGRKTVESRFGKTRSPPYRRVAPGDVVLLKRTGGAVVGLLRVEHAEFITLDGDSKWRHVRKFARAICADDAFWSTRQDKQYATLLHVAAVRKIHPVAVVKNDRRPWVVLQGNQCTIAGPDR